MYTYIIIMKVLQYQYWALLGTPAIHNCCCFAFTSAVGTVAVILVVYVVRFQQYDLNKSLPPLLLLHAWILILLPRTSCIPLLLLLVPKGGCLSSGPEFAGLKMNSLLLPLERLPIGGAMDDRRRSSIIDFPPDGSIHTYKRFLCQA